MSQNIRSTMQLYVNILTGEIVTVYRTDPDDTTEYHTTQIRDMQAGVLLDQQRVSFAEQQLQNGFRLSSDIIRNQVTTGFYPTFRIRGGGACIGKMSFVRQGGKKAVKTVTRPANTSPKRALKTTRQPRASGRALTTNRRQAKTKVYPASRVEQFEFKNVSLDNHIVKNFSTKFERLQECFPGLTKECICDNPRCRGSTLDFVVVNRGFMTAANGFDMGRELATDRNCPGCGRPAMVSNIAFNNCKFRYEWMGVDDTEPQGTRWMRAGDHYWTLPAEGEDVEYKFLNIKVKALDAAVQRPQFRRARKSCL